MTDFSHIAGSPILDLINTVEWRLDDTLFEEDLTSFARVLDWCEESAVLNHQERSRLDELLDQSSSSEAEVERLEVIRMREAAYEALIEHSASAATILADAYKESLQRSDLRYEDGSWDWFDVTIELVTPRDRITRQLVELLNGEFPGRLHQCEDRSCGWVFFDESPRKNRRWCESATCGDRNRARSYYKRHKQRAATHQVQ